MKDQVLAHTMETFPLYSSGITVSHCFIMCASMSPETMLQKSHAWHSLYVSHTLLLIAVYSFLFSRQTLILQIFYVTVNTLFKQPLLSKVISSQHPPILSKVDFSHFCVTYLITIISVIMGLLVCTSSWTWRFSKVECVSYLFLVDLPSILYIIWPRSVQTPA